jgi:TrmH family RNA methyltransferase
MIRSADNQKLKTIRKLQSKRWRRELGTFAAEGEDLVAAAADAGCEPVFVLRSGVDVEPALLEDVSTLGSGARVIGVYTQAWSEPAGALSVYLHGVGDPGNVGTIIRSAHALADGPVILGPGCADPYSPKAVRASMGSVFARPPARADAADLAGTLIALDAGAKQTLAAVLDAQADREGARRAMVLCLGAEREGLPADVLATADAVARIPLREYGPESLNVAMAATVGLYEVANRMAAHG